MKKLPMKFLWLELDFPETGNRHRYYQFVFLNSVFLLSGLVAFVMGFLRWPASAVMGMIDFAYAAIDFSLLAYLYFHRDKIREVGTIALTLAYVLFMAIYILAPYNTMRLSLFFLLAAAALFLKGRRAGRWWVAGILASIWMVHVLPHFDTGYSSFDIFTTSIYLIALFAIFENYELFKDAEYAEGEEIRVGHLADVRIQHELAGEKLFFQTILNNSPLGIWFLGMDGRLQFVNQTFCKAVGISEAQFLAAKHYIEVLPPEISAGCIRSDQQCLAQDTPHLSQEWMPFVDGKKHLLEITKMKVRHPDGSLRGLIGVAADITERKLSEDRLRLTSKVFENTLEGIAIADRDGILLEVNDAFLNITGYSRQELVGRGLGLLQSDRHDESFYDSMWETVRQRGHWRGELWHRRNEKEWQVMLLTLSAITDEAGQVVNYIGIASDITALKQHEKQLEHIAHYDALTGVPNRVLLADRLSQALARTRRDGSILAVCYLDLDGFKQVNDTLGHEAGDRVLMEITRRIKDSIRGDDTVARLGGDEFAVLMMGLNASQECALSLGRLLEAIAQPIEVGSRLFEISASIGVALYAGEEADGDTLLRHADQAMYVAKQSGKNRYHVYDTASEQIARSRLESLRRIQQALEQGEFELFFQPKVDLNAHVLVGAEALIRWRHPERGLVSPAEFLPLVAGSPLEVPLGDWVIGEALNQLEDWYKNGLGLQLSINVSARQLQAHDFAWKLKRKLLKHPGIPEDAVQIEVLETAALEDIPRVSETMQRCRKLGVGFALDDFGTGYSSLSYLSRLPVDTLKIDQSFVRDMLQDAGDHAIVQGVIALARAFDRRTVAEGVESMELYWALQDMGCEFAQGYAIARPMSAHEFPAWLEKWNGTSHTRRLFG